MAKIDIQVTVAGINKAMADIQRLGVAGPGRNVQRAMEQLAAARAVGTPLQQFDAAARLARAQRAFGGGGRGGLQGVVDVFGALQGTLGLFTNAVKSATDALVTMANAAIMSGGTGRDIAFLSGMGMQNIPGRAAAFRANMATNPWARVYGARAGIDPGQFLDPHVGTQNFARGMRQAMEDLRKTTDAEERLRKARAWQMEDMLPLLYASDRAWSNLTASIGRLNVATENTARSASDLQANWQAAKNNIQSLKTWGDMLAGLNVLLDNFNKHWVALGVGIDLVIRVLGDLEALLFSPIFALASGKSISEILKIAWEDMRKALDPAEVRKIWDAAADAQNKAAAAQNNAANAMNNAMKAGQFGGGPRFRDAITGGMLNPQMDAWAFRMGAFGY